MSEQNRGVVLETQPGTVIVLTPQGEFINVPWSKLPYPEIGCEVNFAQPKEKRSIFRYNRLMAVAACLMIMFFSVSLWSGIFLPSSQQVVAYVNVDINPSIELGLNDQGKVVQATGLNQDGELLLQKLKLVNLPADKAVEIITKAAVKDNYLQAGKENTVLITVSDSEKVPEKVKKLEQKVSAQLTANQLSGTTQVIEVSGDLHNKAKELGVSPGKYIVLLEAVDEGLDLSLEDMKGNSVVKAIKMAGGTPGQIISKAQQDKNNYKDLEKRVEDQLRRKEVARQDLDKKLPLGQGKKPAEQKQNEDQVVKQEDQKAIKDNNQNQKTVDKNVRNKDESSQRKDVPAISEEDLDQQDKKDQDAQVKEDEDIQEPEKVEKNKANQLKKDGKKATWSERLRNMWQ